MFYVFDCRKGAFLVVEKFSKKTVPDQVSLQAGMLGCGHSFLSYGLGEGLGAADHCLSMG